MAKTLVVAWFIWAVCTYVRARSFINSERFLKTSATLNIVQHVCSDWFVAEYDVWMGAYIDRKNSVAYWFPVPFVGMKMYLEAKRG